MKKKIRYVVYGGRVDAVKKAVFNTRAKAERFKSELDYTYMDATHYVYIVEELLNNLVKMEISEIKAIIDDTIKTANLFPDREVKLRIDMYRKYGIPIDPSDIERNRITEWINEGVKKENARFKSSLQGNYHEHEIM